MEKLQKVIGGNTTLDTSKHLNVKQVANMLGIKGVSIWKAMRTGRLKYEMVVNPGPKKHPKSSGYSRVTTKEWVDEWRRTINDKNYQTYNGKLMFDKKVGELSSSQARKYIGGWTKNRFMYFVYNQQIKFTRKGFYYIFYKEDLDDFMRRHQAAEEAQLPMQMLA